MKKEEEKCKDAQCFFFFSRFKSRFVESFTDLFVIFLEIWYIFFCTYGVHEATRIVVERTIRFSHLTGSIEGEKNFRIFRTFFFFATGGSTVSKNVEYRPVVTMVQPFIYNFIAGFIDH